MNYKEGELISFVILDRPGIVYRGTISTVLPRMHDYDYIVSTCNSDYFGMGMTYGNHSIREVQIERACEVWPVEFIEHMESI